MCILLYFGESWWHKNDAIKQRLDSVLEGSTIAHSRSDGPNKYMNQEWDKCAGVFFFFFKSSETHKIQKPVSLLPSASPNCDCADNPLLSVYNITGVRQPWFPNWWTVPIPAVTQTRHPHEVQRLGSFFSWTLHIMEKKKAYIFTLKICGKITLKKTMKCWLHIISNSMRIVFAW